MSIKPFVLAAALGVSALSVLFASAAHAAAPKKAAVPLLPAVILQRAELFAQQAALRDAAGKEPVRAGPA